MTVTFGCIGCGNMGGAILKGLSDKENVALIGMDHDPARVDALCEDCKIERRDTPRELAKEARYIMLAVKPHQVREILEDLAPRLSPNQTVISIAAGLTLTQLKTYVSGACPVVRVMPNTPAMVQAGMFALCFDDPTLTEEQQNFVSELFVHLGRIYVLPESSFDAFTAVAGSGPAYVFYFMEAVAEAAVLLGFPREQALEMAVSLFEGSVKLAREDGRHLSLLREMVTSPKGTTIAGTSSLDRDAVRGRILEAVRAAHDRAREMGAK